MSGRATTPPVNKGRATNLPLVASQRGERTKLLSSSRQRLREDWRWTAGPWGPLLFLYEDIKYENKHQGHEHSSPSHRGLVLPPCGRIANL